MYNKCILLDVFTSHIKISIESTNYFKMIWKYYNFIYYCTVLFKFHGFCIYNSTYLKLFLQRLQWVNFQTNNNP